MHVIQFLNTLFWSLFCFNKLSNDYVQEKGVACVVTKHRELSSKSMVKAFSDWLVTIVQTKKRTKRKVTTGLTIIKWTEIRFHMNGQLFP